MSYPQYPYYANDQLNSHPIGSTHSTSQWGVDRHADLMSERTQVSDMPDRSSQYQRNRFSRQWTNGSIPQPRQPNNHEYFSYASTTQTPQHSNPSDYQASSTNTRVYEPRPSPTELIESQSRILEAQTSEIRSFPHSLPLLLNPINDNNRNQNEISTQQSLEESIMLQLQNVSVASGSDRRHSTIETETVSSLRRNDSPPIPQPRMSEYYTNSPLTYSPSSNTFIQPETSSGLGQVEEEVPSPTPSTVTSSYTSPGIGTNPPMPQSTLDSGKQSHPSHYVMIPIGRTGHGKSSLLNSIIGHNEFKASNSVQPVTDAVTERTAIWKVDKKRNLVTVADTPGFADPNRQDPLWKGLIKDYVISIGRRFGIDAFMLTFRLGVSADIFFKIVEEFVGMMEDLQPKTWWDNVIFVFTRFDHAVAPLQQTTALKMLIVHTFIPKIVETYNLERAPTAIFLGTQQPVCGYARGLECDCVEATRHLLDGQRRLLREVRARAVSGRWCYQAPESDEEDDDDDDDNEALENSSQDSGLQRSRAGSVARKLERKQTTKQHTNTVMRNLRQNSP